MKQKQSIIRDSSIKLVLGEVNLLLATAFPKLEELIAPHSLRVDHLYIGYVRDLAVLEHLLNDTYTLMLLTEDQPNKKPLQQFLERRRYILRYAPEIAEQPLNEKWYLKVLELVKQELLELSSSLGSLLSCVYVVLSKLRVIKEVYGAIVTFDKTDLFQREYTDPCWNMLWTFAKRQKLGPAEEIDESVRALYKKLETVTALSEISWKETNSWRRTALELYGGIIYFLDKTQRDRQNIVFKSHIEADLGRSVWNRAQMGVVKFFMNFIYPCICYVRKIYLSARYERITAETVLRWLRKQTSRIQLEKAERHPADTSQSLFHPDRQKIRVRVMCSSNLQRNRPYQGDEADDYDTLIYHVHGGGFVALSSRTHQTYTRLWARHCNAPVFSVDYRKAPEHPYPEGLDDAWQTYNWLQFESHRYFRLRRRKRLILVGDSAGANLIIGITNLCLITETPLPVVLVTYYPCVSFDVKKFTPSYMNVVNNPMIPYEFLSFCAQAYIQRPEFNNQEDFLMQPIYTPLDMLARFPPTYIYQGEKDPLHDHTVKFALRMKQANARVSMVLYESMIHGFLSLNVVMAGIKYADKTVQESIQLLKTLVGS